MSFFVQLLLGALAIGAIIVLFRRNKTRALKTYSDYYAKKRKEFTWLNNWLNEWEKENVDPSRLRAGGSSMIGNILSFVAFGVILVFSNIFFGSTPVILIISIAISFLVGELISRYFTKVNPGDYGDGIEKGLTLECPSCHCPHSWVMLTRENFVEKKETETERTTIKFESGGSSSSTKVTGITYTGRSIKDFKCLNCGRTEHNEYDERWFDKEPPTGLKTFDPPLPAWKIPEGFARQAANREYEQSKNTEAQKDSAPAAAPAPSSQKAQGGTAGINPSLIKAAELGNTEAQGELADMYLLGLGVEKNMDEAKKWLKKLWESDPDEYHDSNDIDEDFDDYADVYIAKEIKDRGISAASHRKYDLAFQLYQMAAEMGNTEAYYHLGCLYEDGKGVPQDKQKALSLFEKGANMGDEDGKSAFKRLKKELK